MKSDIGAVARVLATIESPPGLRTDRRIGDLGGAFDQWFDGGAVKIVTGWNEYHFSDGTLAVVSGALTLQVEIRFPTGGYVRVSEHSQALPFSPLALSSPA